MHIHQFVFLLLLATAAASAAEQPVIAPADPSPSAADAIDPPGSDDPAHTAIAPGTPPDTTESSPDNAVDFMVAAGLQIESGEYIEAERALTKGIESLERTLPRYDMQLVKPLALLGDAQFGKGDFDAARETYSQAVHITRVNDGLHTPEQVPLVYKEAEALAAAGQADVANGRQEYAYETLLRAYGPTSEALVPGMYALADWYVRSYNIYSARELYAHAVDTLTRIHGPDSPELVVPLRGIAETYRQERFPPYIAPAQQEKVTVQLQTYQMSPGLQERSLIVNRYSDGERALGQIIKILNDDPDTPRLDVVKAVLDLADWHLLFEKDDRAFELYERVQALMVSDAGLAPEEVATYFGSPTPLYVPMPPNPEAPPPALRHRATEGYVDLGYTVTERGKVTALETLGADPPGLLDIKVRRAMRIARFRPRFEDGKPVATEQLKYRHSFIYYPASEPEPTSEPAASPDAQSAAQAPDPAS